MTCTSHTWRITYPNYQQNILYLRLHNDDLRRLSFHCHLKIFDPVSSFLNYKMGKYARSDCGEDGLFLRSRCLLSPVLQCVSYERPSFAKSHFNRLLLASFLDNSAATPVPINLHNTDTFIVVPWARNRLAKCFRYLRK